MRFKRPVKVFFDVMSPLWYMFEFEDYMEHSAEICIQVAYEEGCEEGCLE